MSLDLTICWYTQCSDKIELSCFGCRLDDDDDSSNLLFCFVSPRGASVWIFRLLFTYARRFVCLELEEVLGGERGGGQARPMKKQMAIKRAAAAWAVIENFIFMTLGQGNYLSEIVVCGWKDNRVRMFEMDFYAFGRQLERVRGVWSRWWYWWLAAKGVNLSMPLRSKESFGAAGRVLSRSPRLLLFHWWAAYRSMPDFLVFRLCSLHLTFYYYYYYCTGAAAAQEF